MAANSPDLPDFNTLWNFNDPAATEAAFSALVEPARQSGDRSYHLQLLTQLARAQGLQDKFDAAHATLDSVETELRANPGPPDATRVRVRYLLERGRVFNSSGHPEQARPLFIQAWESANAASETKYAADALHMLAIVEPLPTDKVKWNTTALEYIEKHPSEQRWLNAVYNNLGEAYLLMNDYERALSCFQKLIALSEARGQDPWIYTKKDIAKCLRLLNRPAEAITLLQPIHATLEKKGTPDGWISGELAESLLAQGKHAEAKPLFKEAYEAFKKNEYLMRHEAAHIQRIEKMGN